MGNCRLLVPALLAAAAAVVPARASLVITPTFDSSITQDTNAAAIEGAINTAIAVFEQTYTNPINVLIYFQEGGGLGESNFYYYDGTPGSGFYQTYYNALVAMDANPAAIAGLNANGGNSVDNPVTGNDNIDIKSANARAVGIAIAPGCVPTGSPGSMFCPNNPGSGADAVDGIISLNTNITYPPNPNGSDYSLVAVAEHEIDEILGLGSSLPNTSSGSGTVGYLANNPAPEDLFRYTASGTLINSAVNCSSPGSAYFSYSGMTDIAQFNNSCNGDDFGDWATSGQVQSAVGSTGTEPIYGPSEIDALSAIGYTVAAPEPATWALLLVPFLAFVLQRRLTFVLRLGTIFNSLK